MNESSPAVRPAELTLHFSPGACSRVSMIALEEAGLSYALKRVDLQKGEQKSAAFRAVNPKGKVPALEMLEAQTTILTETEAIIAWIAHARPNSQLLPPPNSALAFAQALSLLAWCASGLHPIVTRLRLPQRVCGQSEAYDSIRLAARADLAQQLTIAEDLLERRDWLAGDWSAADIYLFWVFARNAEQFDAGDFPFLRAHTKRMAERPAVQRALLREQGDSNSFSPNRMSV